jgi:putative transcriptional regulator
VGNSLAGRLLVATPKLLDPNFHRTVVFVCMHDEHGAFGLVLNRPLEAMKVAETIPVWSEHVSTPALVFLGGPVEPNSAIALGRSRAGLERDGWTRMTGTTGLVNLEANPEELMDDLEAVRVFAGYAGWGAGQIEGEIKEDAWFVVEAEPGDPFTGDPGHLWSAVLKRQRGKLAMFAFAPSDPSVN